MDDLVADCLDKCDLTSVRATRALLADGAVAPPPAVDEEALCRELLVSLDLTGDGRLHFYEFLGALVAAGRVEVPDHDVEHAFAAFDVDCDGAVSIEDLAAIGGSSATQDIHPKENPVLSLPVTDPGAILRSLRGELDMVCPLSPALSNLSAGPMLRQATDPLGMWRRHSSPGSSSGSPANRAKPAQRFLSKCELHQPWQVERRFAFERHGEGSRIKRSPRRRMTEQEAGGDRLSKRSPSALRHGRRSAPTLV